MRPEGAQDKGEDESKSRLSGPSMFIGKQGNGIISFGSGQPDLPPPREAISNLKIRSDLRYGLIQGELPLREALAREYPGSTADNFVVTNGASEALDLVFRSIGKGKVLLGKPYYYSYVPILGFAGLEPVFTNLQDGRIDLADFQEKVKGCKAVLINSPSNPTGRIESMKTLKEIEKIARDLRVYIVSDEVYKDLIYERENYMIKGEHVITINSFSKTYCMCGARVGYFWSSDPQVVQRAIEMKTHTSMNTSLVGQDMALNAMSTPKSYVEKQKAIWKTRRDFIYERMRGMGLDLWKPEGAFYVLPKIKHPRRFVLDMYNKHKVITYLGEWFGAPDRVRFSYALDVKEIDEGLRRVEKYLNSR
ncbi:pyridoxal phosphate-dependent aminotransferase [Candidatus Woesearchaeota archaeon]|nr:pyridoxal phosphate-dependent aminotransferase [Candidatus Woesearchaeota archaeon]